MRAAILIPLCFSLSSPVYTNCLVLFCHFMLFSNKPEVFLPNANWHVLLYVAHFGRVIN